MMAAHFRSLAEPARAEVFRRIGLPMDHADQVGVALIRPAGDGRFEFDNRGDVAALIEPVVDVYSDDGVDVADYADLVAVDANDPCRAWSLTGSTEMLGEANLASLFGCRLRIHQSPLEWWIAGRNGVAVIKWTAGVAAMLHATPNGIVIAKQQREFAEFVDRKITAATRPAEIYLSEGER